MVEWERTGTTAVLERIPDGGRYYLSIDADGLDPAVMPAVMNPQPGGVTYRQTIDLIKGLTRKGKLVGVDIVEIAPFKDINEITCLTAGHIVPNIIGAIVRSSAFNSNCRTLSGGSAQQHTKVCFRGWLGGRHGAHMGRKPAIKAAHHFGRRTQDILRAATGQKLPKRMSGRVG